MSRKHRTRVHGWIILDKPQGLTSTQALGKVRYLLNAEKAGHGGTLDPLATGILPIALGEATKTLPFIVDGDKSYDFDITWGQERDTDDSQGTITAQSPERPAESAVRELLPRFIGMIEQTPPRYSAIKIDGERAYDLARAGEEVALKARSVHVHDLTLLAHTDTHSQLRLVCGKGTYVRSLARDLGRLLGCFGYVSALRRTRVGPFSEENMISLDKLSEICNSSDLTRVCVLPMLAALDGIPALPLNDAEADKITHGQMVPLISKDGLSRLQKAGIDPRASGSITVCVTWRGEVLALADVVGVDVQPVRVFRY